MPTRPSSPYWRRHEAALRKSQRRVEPWASPDGSPMTPTPRLSGAYAPILTPFTPDGGTIDWEAYRQQLDYLRGAGLDGVVVLGTNGEYGQLSDEEKYQLVTTTLEANTGLRVIVGGTKPESASGTLALLARLETLAPRIAAVLVAPPFFRNYAAGETVAAREVVQFYRSAVQMLDGLPLLLYNVPVPAGGQVTAEVTPQAVATLADEPGIVGIKDSSGQAELILAYQAARPGLRLLVGSDHLVAAAVDGGAAGSVTACANVFPAAVLAVYRASQGPEREAAQARLSALRRVLELVPGKLVAAQKMMLARLGVVPRQSPVRVGGELTPDEAAAVWEALEAAGGAVAPPGRRD